MTEFCITITYTGSSPSPADAARAADAAAAGGGRVTSLSWESLDTPAAETTEDSEAAAAERIADTAAAGPVSCGPADWRWVGLTLPEPDGRRPRTRMAHLTCEGVQNLRDMLERMSGRARDLPEAERRSVVCVISRPGKSPLMLVQDVPLAHSVSLLLAAIEGAEL